ncbi:DUF342 domain-containing protein [Metabacillus sp. 84]|uniref:DUF342 domain-containing protein n=1 Tax=Metabacillus sp. 84 TaxID=3404705 RepID=UPI003CED22EB
MILIENDFFKLEEEKGTVSLCAFQKGFLLSDVNKILDQFPRVSITSFQNLKKAIAEAVNQPVNIGVYLPLVTHLISKDKMTASLKVLATPAEFDQLKTDLAEKALETLNQAGITEGLNLNAIQDGLVPMQWVEAAKGIAPVHGRDASVRYYELSERKPTIQETGKADFYHLNFIDEVEQGEWLGEKIPPTDGTDGVNVLGEVLKAKKGKDKKLLYDQKTVRVAEEDGRFILRAAIRGIVSSAAGKISVANHLRIDGDVGIATGNIEFDGSVTVNGTVHEGFSVKAGVDIAILSEMGVREVERIESLNGDIFIKGGVFGKGIIRAAKTIFVKHANECTLEAGEDIHIGFYSKGSRLIAKNVITEEHKGKIFGGVIEAKGRVFANEIGNKIELKTIIQVEGFDRIRLQEDYVALLTEYKQSVQMIEEIQRHIDVYESFSLNLNDRQQAHLQNLKKAYDEKLKEISTHDQHRETLMKMLKIKGDGEISICRSAYPETYIEIKNMKKKVESLTRGTFYVTGRELKYE